MLGFATWTLRHQLSINSKKIEKAQLQGKKKLKARNKQKKGKKRIKIQVKNMQVNLSHEPPSLALLATMHETPAIMLGFSHVQLTHVRNSGK